MHSTWTFAERLELSSEPTMGNYDQEFIIYGQEFTNFYSKLKQFPWIWWKK